MNVEEFSKLHTIESVPPRITLYGDPGTGKTSLSQKLLKTIFPNPSNKFLYITTDSGTSVLEEDGRTYRLPFKPAPHSKNKQTAFGMLYEALESDASAIVIDTMSTAMDDVLIRIIQLMPDEKSKNKELASWPHYRVLKTYTRTFFQAVRQSNKPIIFIAHQSESTESSSIRGLRPQIPEGSLASIISECNIVAQTKVSAAGRYEVDLKPSISKITKTQYPEIRPVVYSHDDFISAFRDK